MHKIYNYIDYRKYLLEYIADKKLKNPKFSCRMLSMQLGISPATLVRILNGKRNLSKKMLPRFAGYLKLRKRASEYLRLMVDLAKGKGTEKKVAAYQRLLDFRSKRIKTIRPRHYSFFEKWYLPVLREIIDIRGKIDKASLLSSFLLPEVTAKKASDAVDTLISMKMITEKKKGCFYAAEKLLSTGENWESPEIHHFQIQMADLAQWALTHVNKNERDISTLTVGLSSEEFIRVKEIIRRARQEILAIAENSTDREFVYQINMQLFPLTRNLKRRSRNDK